MSDSVRAYIAAELTPSLPHGWRVIKEQRVPDRIDRTTVVIATVSMERLPEAPIGNIRHTVTLGVLSSYADLAAAEDDLDEAVLLLTAAIDGHPKIGWSEAKKTVTKDTWSWDITLTVITEKEA